MVFNKGSTVKDKFTLCLTQGVWKSGCINSRILDLGASQLHAPRRFTCEEIAPGTTCIGGWVGLRTGMNDVERREILPPPVPELQPFYRPARIQSLYRLRNPGVVVEMLFHALKSELRACGNKG
jgi:hypothetical protein